MQHQVTIHGEKLPLYQIPQDADAYFATWWTAKKAARMWGVHHTTARRWMHAHPGACARVAVDVFGHTKVLWCVRADTHRHLTSLAGNPLWRERRFQRRMALKRWQKARQESSPSRAGSQN